MIFHCYLLDYNSQIIVYFHVRIARYKKSFGSYTVFDGITITLPAARAYALTGINGSGKSTFLKILWGKLRPDSGEILYNHQKVDPQSRSWKSMISVVPDDNALITSSSKN